MTSIKDKLASSVRQAKSTTPSKVTASRAAAEDTDTKQTNIQAEPAQQTTAPAHSQSTVANPEPASSAQALFPDRVWPD